MNDKINKVIKQKEEQMREKKAREEFERQHKMFAKSKIMDLQD